MNEKISRMLTKTGIITILVSALIIALILTSGCTSKTEEKKDGLVEILRVEGCDKIQQDSCCYAECKSFCSENGQSYSKHFANYPSCGCWCS